MNIVPYTVYCLLYLVILFSLAVANEYKYEYTQEKLLGIKEVVRRCAPAICRIEDKNGYTIGSGVIIHPTGVMLTNRHVLEKDYSQNIILLDANGQLLTLEGILEYDIEGDWVAVKVSYADGNNSRFPYTKIGDSRNLEVGQPCVAIGNPSGLNLTVTQGIISSLGRTIRDCPYTFIQHDAACASGSSGGGLFDLTGGLIGIIVSGYGSFELFLDNKTSPINFAIPIDRINLPRNDDVQLSVDCLFTFLCGYAQKRILDDETDWVSIKAAADRALIICPDFYEARYLLAESELYLKNPRNCIKILSDSKQSYSLLPRSRFLIGLAHIFMGEFAAAINCYEAIKTDSPWIAHKLLTEINRARKEERQDFLDFWVPIRTVRNDDILTTEHIETPAISAADSLTAVEHWIFTETGSDGLMVWSLIDNDRNFKTIQDMAGISYDYLTTILNNFLELDLIEIDRFRNLNECLESQNSGNSDGK